MNVIAGLGNPGAEYANTPHSIGFEVVDELARRAGAEWKKSASFKGELAQGVLGGVQVLLVKPATYMNLSGTCIAPVVKYRNSSAEDLIVVSDDIDLPAGRIRVRKGGSAGGHNGLKSVIECLGTADFTRVKVGVGRREERGGVVAHVLGKIDARQRAVFDEAVQAAADAAADAARQGIETVMNRYNGWRAPSAAAGTEKENQ